jgi:hypothetical protein
MRFFLIHENDPANHCHDLFEIAKRLWRPEHNRERCHERSQGRNLEPHGPRFAERRHGDDRYLQFTRNDLDGSDCNRYSCLGKRRRDSRIDYHHHRADDLRRSRGGLAESGAERVYHSHRHNQRHKRRDLDPEWFRIAKRRHGNHCSLHGPKQRIERYQ